MVTLEELARLDADADAERRRSAWRRALVTWRAAWHLRRASRPTGPILAAARAVSGEGRGADLLSAALFRRAPEAMAYVGIGGEGPIPKEEFWRAWSPRFADYLEGFGEAGAGVAQQIRGRWAELEAEHPPPEPPRLWDTIEGPPTGPLLALWDDPDRDPDPPRWLDVLARVLWDVEVADRVETQGLLLAPAVFPPVLRVMERAGPHRVVDGRIVDRRGRTTGLVLEAPALEAPALDQLRGVERFGSVLFDAVIRMMAFEAFRLFVDDPDHRMIVEIEGGDRGCAQRLGFTSRKDAVALGALFEAMTRTSVALEHRDRFRSTVLLVDYDKTPAAPGRPARVRLELSPLFAPQVVQSVPKGHPDRALIPVLEGQPPLDAVNNNKRAAALAMEWGALEELQRQCVSLFNRGCVDLDWSSLADEAGLPSSSVGRVLDSWTGGDNPRWTRVGGAWTLGPSHEAALRLVRRAGEKKIEGRRGGRARRKA